MIENFNQFMEVNPHYGYLIAAAGFAFYLLGLILDWDWTVEPGGGYFNVAFWIHKFGRKTVRITLGFFILLGLMSTLALFFYAN
ncbi:hypothetical protein G1K75_12330 [Tenacibaculum finnmarkense]|uniref:immunity 17 family protein n=1 Tax=Tenacibaculum finnmarkense TaxID=2781243 RepID=UPI00187B9F25|nr:immunity 17 family protein [Tenacibaculum finnmarkense]MBE7649224.1 hypothetical protein [Tenacibaculum finnmarkense genomovar ulcerans]MCD8401268.1 immunity 17 family protein [Tenacibaculum finnmarkense genomovar ulcerans]MCG8806438.1 hypothetical protein [Tenacibaculum finnmarkense]MCG8857532.1 hypothetical protein [Tenacibaculum finnmarkense]WCC41206.1 immunity 17 family protein [Tenacibaculum finnmarkense]